MKYCIEKGCKSKMLTRKLCSMHYQRVYKYGTNPDFNKVERHGMCGTVIHKTWNDMMIRTCRKSGTAYKRYCEKYGTPPSLYKPWLQFSSFYKYVGDHPGTAYSLDRIDNFRGYEPGNLRWATNRVQSINRTPHYRK